MWNLVVQTFMIAAFIFFINLNFHPLTWLQDWIRSVLDWRTWFYFFPLSAVVLAQGVVCSKGYISVQPFYPTRFSIMIQILSLNNIMSMSMHVFIGYLITWLYLSVTGGMLSRYAMPDGTFNEERLLLIFGGVWVNFVYFVKNHFAGAKHATFPVLQLPKFSQIKSELFLTVKSSFPDVFLPNCFYIVLYYFKGNVLRGLACQLFDLQPSEELLDSVQGLFNIKMLAYLWLLSATVISTMKLMEFLFRVYLTEREIFPYFSTLLPAGTVTLEEALRSREFPFLRHLGFLDLFLLSENSKERRAKIFTLSQPGGHPHIWNSLRNDCFLTIESFITSLTGLLIFRQTKEKPEETYHRYGIQPGSAPPTSPLCAKTLPKKATFPELLFSKIIQAGANLSLWVDSKLSWLYNLPFTVYFFGDRRDLQIKYALQQTQPVLWACHSLSYLAVYSLTEDNYGIIQNDLAKIICLLLKLKQTLDSIDRHVSVQAVDPCASWRTTRTNNSKTMTAQALNKSVKRAIYRISDAFKNYIPDLQLPRDAEIQMIAFAEYKV